MASSASTTAHEIHPHTHDQTDPSPIYTIKPTGDAIDPQGDGSSSITDDLSAISSEDDAIKGYLCDWADLPHWMQDNPAIWTGYRRPTFSYKKCIASLGFLHNESGFYCHKTWQAIYLTLITIFGVATIVAVVRPEFRTPHYRWIRSCLFLTLGLCGVFPVIHGIVLYGIPLAQVAISLNYMICMGSSYVVGALIYASRTPERLFPGKMDHFGASHQIFHIFVLIGCLSHFLGVTKAMAFWHDANHTCAIPVAQMRIDYVA
ncbi:hypothetical protein BGZ51_003555 [Haplosporangium sp. Z 767]|nr:hypothetical protein BGZ51_003555 [Haplosporangium sp. Z 767]KAF9190158.1 hypothetical protein BGZ50_000371 [Haplosporangium sp. Z 11]